MRTPRQQHAIISRLGSPSLPGISLGLDRVYALLGALGSPHEHLPPVIHVAGTNGKGSLIACLRATLASAGYRVHQYTSPSLVRPHERILLGGKEISDTYLRDILKRVRKKLRDYPVTPFEAITVAAFLAFSERAGDVLLLETGMGGRLDATNVVAKPELTVITPVSIDHAEFLGNTLEKIAAEKAGIIKPGVPCVVGPQSASVMKVISEKAKQLRTPLWRHEKEWSVEKIRNGFVYAGARKQHYPLPNLAGSHQIYNAATAVACIEALSWKVSKKDIEYGSTHAQWKARLQKLAKGPLPEKLPRGWELWLDGGHNPAAGEVLGAWADTVTDKPLYIICGMLANKDAAQFLKPLASKAQMLCATGISGEKSYSATALAGIAKGVGMEAFPATSAGAAIEKILSLQRSRSGRILICGSLYLAGHILAQNS